MTREELISLNDLFKPWSGYNGQVKNRADWLIAWRTALKGSNDLKLLERYVNI